MSPTDQSIRPALASKEWPVYGDEIRADPKRTTPERRNANHFTMAISNAYLPDDDPRKITRKDVETVRHEAVRIATEWSPEEGDAVVLFALAAKLAALLPPE